MPTTDAVHPREERLSQPAARMLDTIARVRAATAHTLIAHHCTEAPETRTARAGYLTLARLKAEGLVRTRLLEPERGSVSREVLYLADAKVAGAAGEALGIEDLSARQLDAVLQSAEVVLTRDREGWRVVPQRETAAVFLQATLNAWDVADLTEDESVMVSLLRHRRELPVPGRLLVRGDGPTLEARVVLPVWSTAAAERIAEGLPLQRVRSLEIELVASDESLATSAVAVLQQAANEAGRPIVARRIAPYRDRPNPARSQDPIPTCDALLTPPLRPYAPTLVARKIESTAGLPLFTGEPTSRPVPGRTARRHAPTGSA